jgi:hypothetical protein
MGRLVRDMDRDGKRKRNPRHPEALINAMFAIDAYTQIIFPLVPLWVAKSEMRPRHE